MPPNNHPTSSQCGPQRPEEDGLLRHRRGSGRSPQSSDEQLPGFHHQPAGDRVPGRQGAGGSGGHLELGGSHVQFWGTHRAPSLLPQIHETIESINQLKTQRDFMLSFSNNPQDFIQEWIKSQRRDLKVKPWSWAEHRGVTSPGVTLHVLLTLCPAQIITDVIGNPEEERRAEFYQQPWAQEAVGRHIFAKVGSGPGPGGCCGGWDGSGWGVSGAAPHPASTHVSSRSSSVGRNWNKCWGSA